MCAAGGESWINHSDGGAKCAVRDDDCVTTSVNQPSRTTRYDANIIRTNQDAIWSARLLRSPAQLRDRGGEVGAMGAAGFAALSGEAWGTGAGP